MSGQGHHLLDKGASADFYRDLKNAINQHFCQGLKSHPFKWQEFFCQEFQIASMASPFGKGWQVSLHLQPTLLSRAGRPLFSGLQISPHPCQPRIGQLPAKNASGQLCRHATCCSCGVDPHLPALIHNLLAVIKKYWDVVVFAIHSLALAPCFLPGESDLVKIFHQVLLLQLFQDHF